MTKTEHYDLPQWEKTDRVLMEDFNAAFLQLERRIPRIATGTYVGTGTYGASKANTLTFSFSPVLVIIKSNDPGTDILFAVHSCTKGNSNTSSTNTTYVTTIRWTEDQLSWYAGSASSQLNLQGKTYYYFAIG